MLRDHREPWFPCDNIPCGLAGGDGGGLLEVLRAAGPQAGKPGHMAGPGSGTTCIPDCSGNLPG